MKKFLCLLFSIWSIWVCAQTDELLLDSNTIVTTSFGENWFGQIGVDMSLQNPYGSNFIKHVFPNGKTYGLDIALGKRLTPEYSLRGKLNWEAGAIKSEHAKWIHTDHGYLIGTGDFQVNLINVFKGYDPERKWNAFVYPRAGAFLNLTHGTVVGSPVLGLGTGASYRLKDRWSVYGDVAYQVVTSVIGNPTGTGTGNNGYFDIDVGIQFELSNDRFYKVSQKTHYNKHDVALNPFWSNWFFQLGLGMSLLNPYGRNFAKVFPNGKTFGVNLGIGKWVIPEFGLRLGGNWQNGIVGNKHLIWLDQDGKGSNHDKGGFGAIYVDAFVNIHNMLFGYEIDRCWNAIVFPRAGLDRNFETSGSSPLIGLGTEHTFQLTDKLKLFGEIVYQVTSGDFMGPSSHRDGSSNGWFDVNVGVQFELGKSMGRFIKVNN